MAVGFSIKGAVSLNMGKVTNGMKKAGRAVTGFSNKMRGQLKMADFSAKKLNKTLSKIGSKLKLKQIATAGFAALSVGVGLAAREFVRFDDAIFGATARFKSAEKPGTDMTKVMVDLKNAAREVGATTQFTATQAAKGLDKFALAGFTSQEAIKSLRSQIDLATVTGEDFMRVTDISSDLLGAFGGAALDSEAKISKLKEMNSLLAVATLSANVTMEDLFETLKIVAPIATQAGKSMKDTIATVSVLGSAGIKGSLAATAMKNVFLNLSAPTRKVAAALDKVGLAQKDLIDSTGKLKTTTEIFGLIGDGMKSLTKVEQSAVFKDLFGLRGIAGAGVIVKNIKQIREQLIKMGKDPQAVMAETAKFMRQSLGNRLKTLGSAATELAFKFFEAFDGPAKDGISNLTAAISEFDMKPIVEGFKAFLAVAKIIGGVIGRLTQAWPELLAVFVGFKTAMLVASVAATVFGTTLKFAVLGPIGLAITFVVLFAIYVIKNWDTIKAKTFEVGAAIKNGFFAAIEGVKLIINSVTGFFSSAWESIKAGGIAAGQAIKAGFMVAFDFIKKIVFTFADYFLTIWGTIIKGVLFAASKIGGALGIDTSQIDGIINKVAGLQQSVRSQSFLGEAIGQGGTSAFASPQSRAIAGGQRNVTQNGEINVNVAAPGRDTTVQQRGGMPAGLSVNLGEG